jgi:hypothetical protein
MSNDFIPFAVGGSANVTPQATYAANTTLTQGGFQSGLAKSPDLNKVWRQSSIMAAVLAQFIVDQSGQNAVDDGTTATLEANLISAVRNAAKQTVILTDTGAANAYTATNTPALTVLPGTGYTQRVNIAHANTGASTYAPDGLTAKPIYGLGLQPLQGGELPVGVVVLMYLVQASVNSGNGAWIIIESLGGAQQIPPATQSQHAVQLGQMTGRLLRTTIYTLISGVQNVSVNGGAFTTTGATTFVPLSNTTTVIGESQGGGGAGGGAGGAGASTVSMGAPGSSGSYGKSLWTIGTFGASQTITVGAGGVAVSNGTGGNGGSSSIGALLTTPGGTGGGPLNAQTPPSANGNGSFSTAATGANLISIRGTAAQVTLGLSLTAGIAGTGGASPYGPGAPGPAINTSGIAAVNYGTGGSGIVANQTGGSGPGGNGFAGIVIITEYA